MMRIITGSARGTKLAAPEGEATRPTSERVKEAVFSMLQFELEGRRILDLFAGSGQLGLEALSRGAAHATLIDASRDAVAIIMENAKKTHLFDRTRISCADHAAYLRGAAGKTAFDIVFLDPPYASGLLPAALSRLAEYKLLAPGAVVVCETDSASDRKTSRRHADPAEEAAKEAETVLRDVFGGDEGLRERFTVARTVTYGRTRITVLRLPTEVNEGEGKE